MSSAPSSSPSCGQASLCPQVFAGGVTPATAPSANPSGDFFDLDGQLTAQERELRMRVRTFMESHSADLNDAYERAEFPHHLLEPIAKEIGVGGLCSRGYGCQETTPLGACLTAMEIARVDGSLFTFHSVHGNVAMLAIDKCGSEEQKKRWLPKMAACELIGSFALTEPDFGSDATALESTARRVKGGFILNGKKRWIGNALFDGLIVVWARDLDTQKIAGFVVEPTKTDPATLKRSRIEHKISQRMVQNANIELLDCFVPDENVLPGGTDFSKGAGLVLHWSRLIIAWGPVGLSMGAFDRCLHYLQHRKQFGVPLVSFQLVQDKLMRMLANIQAMLYMALQVTGQAAKGKMTSGQVSLLKAHNTWRGRECVALARELLGGNGIVDEPEYGLGVARCFLDMEAMHTYEGTFDINILVAGREVTKVGAFKAKL